MPIADCYRQAIEKVIVVAYTLKHVDIHYLQKSDTCLQLQSLADLFPPPSKSIAGGGARDITGDGARDIADKWWCV